MRPDNWDKKFDDEFDENLKKATRWARIGLAVSLVASVGLIVLTTWAVITLISWAVTK